MTTLNARLRGSLPKKAFVIPPKRGEAPSERGGYPIPDREHAGLAVGMARKYAPPAVRAKVEAAVAKKFPDLPSSKNLRGRIAASKRRKKPTKAAGKRGAAVQARDTDEMPETIIPRGGGY